MRTTLTLKPNKLNDCEPNDLRTGSSLTDPICAATMDLPPMPPREIKPKKSAVDYVGTFTETALPLDQRFTSEAKQIARTASLALFWAVQEVVCSRFEGYEGYFYGEVMTYCRQRLESESLSQCEREALRVIANAARALAADLGD